MWCKFHVDWTTGKGVLKENQLNLSNGKTLYYYIQDQTLGAACEQLITRNQAFIPAFVRLIFHDVTGVLTRPSLNQLIEMLSVQV